VAQHFCADRLTFDAGLIILDGIPFGLQTFTAQHQQAFTTKFNNLLDTVQTMVVSPQAKFLFFSKSIQPQVPFWQFIDGITHFTDISHPGLDSVFT
jgi:hypothetical protein